MTVRVCLSLGMHMVDETQLKGVRGFKTFVCANGCEKPRKSQRKRKKEKERMKMRERERES